MGQIKNLVGQRFGKLVVIKLDYIENHRSFWLCKCDCGNFRTVRIDRLTSGKVKSCHQCAYIKDLTNQRFGHLTAIKYVGIKNSHAQWLCKCDCGNECIVSSNHLLDGQTTSCGCVRSKGENIIVDLLNKNNFSFKQEYTFSDLKDIKPLRFDFAIFTNQLLLIEYDGLQHFHYYSSGWNVEETFTLTKKHDEMKNIYCKQHNIPLLRIPYTYTEEQIKDAILDFIK